EGLLIGHPAVGFGSLWVANPDVSPSSGAPQQTRSSDAPTAPKEPSQPPRPSPWLQRIDLGTGVATGIALPESADPYQVVARMRCGSVTPAAACTASTPTPMRS